MVTQTRRRTGDTRDEIQRAALGRFTNQGYDKTSLREIAEDLGVTKAAVYYHFHSKEEILESLVRSLADSLDELIAWAQSAPMTRERQLELLRRMGEATSGGGGDLMRCVQQNELALAAMPTTVDLVHRYKSELWRAATPDDAGVEDRMRVRLAVMAVLLSNQGLAEVGGTAAERQQIAQRIAADLLP
ncbi:MAG: TetR/AcrR family transcriptional regulator [Cellulomonadaceae bacterium]|nr:TetR/AcrR family transcriptional regulator [Cellulomonadaceae bacterium]